MRLFYSVEDEEIMTETSKQQGTSGLRSRWRGLAAAAAYAALSTYFRFRPQPEGINGERRTYRVPAEGISFYHDTTWYEHGQRHTTRQITEEVVATIRKARRFVLMDVFLFNLHHASKEAFIPTTRQIAEAFQEKDHPCFFITDPLNTSYGTAYCEPLDWLREGNVEICLTDLDEIRDNNLLYAPFWHLLPQWFGTEGAGWFKNPLRKETTTTLRAVLTALTLRSNHRKVLIADEDDTYVALVTSSNFEDASCYFANTALKIKSQAVARHFLEAEKAVAQMSGCQIPLCLPEEDSAEASASRMAEVTPLMGSQIKEAILEDLHAATAGDELFVIMLFLSDRDIIDGLIRACLRGVSITLILDRNNVSFGSKKHGFPNHLVAAELAEKSDIHLRWANTQQEETHTKFILLRKEEECILHTGSANLTRRSLSNTNLEANVRVTASPEARVCQTALQHVRWLRREPASLPAGGGDASRLKYWWYRFQEAAGIATF